MAKKKLYTALTPEEYNARFGINSGNNELQKEAFKKAWEIRNFEIDKFWQRSAYFWGFIAIIFGGYISVATGKSSEIAKELYFDLYLILLGIIFSVGWLLVICGSKIWQDNWEAHVGSLEDAITGPLYKTLYCTKRKFYSVSKINKILAWVVIITWCLLLAKYIFTNCSVFWNVIKCFSKNLEIVLFVFIPITGASISILVMKLKGQTSDGEFRVNLKENQDGAFIDRTEYW